MDAIDLNSDDLSYVNYNMDGTSNVVNEVHKNPYDEQVTEEPEMNDDDSMKDTDYIDENNGKDQDEG